MQILYVFVLQESLMTDMKFFIKHLGSLLSQKETSKVDPSIPYTISSLVVYFTQFRHNIPKIIPRVCEKIQIGQLIIQ